MQMYTLGLLAMSFMQAPANELGKAEILERVNAAGIRREQTTAFANAARTVQQARAEHQRQMSVISGNPALGSAVDALASGRQLTADERAALDAAKAQRRKLDADLETRIGQAVNAAMSALDDEQRFRLAVSEEDRRRAAETVNQVRTGNDQEFQRLSRTLAFQLMRPEFERMRAQMRPPASEAGASREEQMRRAREQMQTRRGQNQQGQQGQRGQQGQQGQQRGRGGNDQMRQFGEQMRAQMQEAQRTAQQRLQRVRSGDAAAARDLERALALSRGQAQAERRLREQIFAIIGAEESVAALEMRR